MSRFLRKVVPDHSSPLGKPSSEQLSFWSKKSKFPSVTSHTSLRLVNLINNRLEQRIWRIFLTILNTSFSVWKSLLFWSRCTEDHWINELQMWHIWHWRSASEHNAEPCDTINICTVSSRTCTGTVITSLVPSFQQRKRDKQHQLQRALVLSHRAIWQKRSCVQARASPGRQFF